MVNKAEGHDCNAITKLFAFYEFSNNIWRYSEKYNVFQVRFSNTTECCCFRSPLCSHVQFLQIEYYNRIHPKTPELLFSDNVFENVVLKQLARCERLLHF